MLQDPDKHMTRKYRIAIGLCISAASVLFLLAVLEVYLRVTIDAPAELEAGLTFNRSQSTKYFQRIFLDTYDSSEGMGNVSHDSYLGWDYNVENGRTRESHTSTPDLRGEVSTIIAIGDSFTFGSEVGPDESFPHYLDDSISNSKVLNMGVPGFGIDQAVLKYLKYGSQLEPDVLVFGILPDDYNRASNSFRSFSKPVFRFNEESNSVELTNTDIKPPQEVFDDLSRSLRPPKLYSLAFLKNRITKAYWRVDSGAEERYYRDTDVLVEHALTQLLESTEATDTKLLIVQIPLGNRFSSDEHLAWARRYQAHTHLLEIYEKLGIPYLDLIEEFTVDNSREQIFNDFYIYKAETSRGHFTPRGNQVVAQLIKEELENLR